VVCIIAIVLFHARAGLDFAGPVIAYVFFFYFKLLAAPVFFLISLYLYAIGPRNLRNRLSYLSAIYVIWMPINNVIQQNITPLSWIIGSESPMWFLFELILLTAIVEGLLRVNLSPEIVLVGLLLSFLPPCFLSTVLPGQDPINMLPYAFAAVVTVKAKEKAQLVLIITTGALVILRTFLLFGFGIVLPVFVYTQPDIVFLAMSILFLLRRVTRQSRRFASLAKLVMWVFVIHYTFIVALGGIFPGIDPWVSGPISLVAAFGAGYCLEYVITNKKRIPSKTGENVTQLVT
jgi:hypothetical protein